MGTSIVMIHKNNLLVGTSAIAKGFGTEHRYIKSLIEKYKNEFEEWGEVFVAGLQKPTSRKGGRPLDEYLLNEPQAAYLATLMSNTEKVRKFKHQLTKEFFKQRTALNEVLLQRKNVEWIEHRIVGKIERRIETDAIKEFIEYAKKQGSKSCHHYYNNYTRMQYSILFPEKYANFQGVGNFRDCLNRRELNIIETSDMMISACIRDLIKLEYPYKEIFQEAKKRTEALAIGLGITPIQRIIEGKNEVRRIQKQPQ